MPAAVAAADEGLQRFRALLASQVATLGNALAAGFERELREVRQAGQQAAEAERTSRLAAEVDVRQLELEFERLRSELGELRVENGELCRRAAAAARAAAAPTPKRAPSESAEGSDPEPFFSTRGDAGRDDEDDDASPGSAQATPQATPLLESLRCPQDPPRTAVQPACLRERTETTPAAPSAAPGSQGPPLMPSRIPKPKGLLAKADGGEGEPEEQRMLKLNITPSRPVSGSPVPARNAEERSTTPSGLKVRRKVQEEDGPGHPGCRNQRMGVMQDKRTLRRIHKDAFRAAILDWRENHRAPGGKARKNQVCQVFVRLRPMFEKENQQGEFESVSTFQEWGEVIVHSCLFQADLVRMYVQHSGFCFPRTFGPEASNEDVYAECGSSLVAHALSGQLSTIFMFGQTGSGKTYTMNTIIDMAAAEIFGSEGVASAADPAEAGVRLRVFEIKGNKCVDLMSRARSELKLLESEDGRTNVVGAQETPVSSVEDLQRAVHEAFARRATASHGRNEESSRSHCICIVELPAVKGSLVLVDCAGTERRQDTDQHSAERTKESAEINSSLHALKECIRYRAKEQRQALQATKSGGDEERKQVHVPYRGSYLTRVLAESFTRAGSRLAAIGTVAPSATDVEHTLSTLRTLQLLMNETGSTDAPNFDQRVDLDPKLVQLWTARMKKGGTEGEASLRSANSTPCGSHRRIRSDAGRADADERT